VPKTLLAVDDSATMRKVLEITFGGEDFRVLTADGTQRALAQMSEEPVAVVIDTSLVGEDDPYGLARQIRARDGRVAIVLLGSRYTPYDARRGHEAGADDSIDKPFDTQQLIDKVKKAIVAREGAGAATQAAAPAPAPAAPAAPVFQPPAPTPSPAAVSPFSSAPRPPAAPPAAAARPGFGTQRTHTLSFEGGPPAPPPAASPPPPAVVPGAPPRESPISRTAPSGMPVIQAPAPPPASRVPAPAPPTAVPSRAVPTSPSAQHAPVPVAAAVNGHLAGKLGDLGLSPAQVDAVLALSREVVERVVWEVVPQLAETIIKEEIARLTKD
jgi:CheY-like chemotaxis protein